MARTRTRNQDQSDANKSQTSMSDSRRRRRETDGTSDSAPARKDRPTPSARPQKASSGGNGIINRIPVVRSIAAYLRGVSSELQKVTWPTRDETIRLTTIVLAVTIAFAVVLGLLDLFLAQWFRQAFNPDSEPVFLAILGALAVIIAGTYATVRNRI